MIKLISMSLRNFLSIGNKTETFNFRENAITVFRGDIGSGKSTLIDAISILIFGKSYSKKNISSIINWYNKRNCEMTLIFEINGTTYEIIRNFKPDSYALNKIIDGERVTIELSNKDDLTDKVVEILMIDRKIFDQTVFLSQKHYEPFMEMSLTNKRELIKRLFSLEKYDAMKDEVSADIKEKEKQTNVLDGRYSALETQVKTMKENRETKIKEIENNISIIEKEMSQLITEKESIIIPDFDEESFKQLSADIQSKKTEIEVKKEQIKKAKEEWETYNTNLEDIKAKKLELKELKEKSDTTLDVERKDSLLEETIALKNDIDYVVTNKAEYDKHKQIILTYNESDIPQIENEMKILEEEFKALSKEFAEKSVTNVENGVKIKSLKEKMEYYSDDKNVCSECGKAITDEEKREKKEFYQKEINSIVLIDTKELNDKATVRATTIDSMKGLIADLKKAFEKLNSLKVDKIESFEKLKKEFISSKELLDKVSEEKKLRDKISGFERDLAQPLYNTPKEDVSLLEKSLDGSNDALKVLEEKLKLMNDDFITFTARKSERVGVENKIVIKESLLKREKELLVEAMDEKYINSLEEAMKETKSELDVKMYEIDLLQKIVVTLGDAGIKKFIIGRYLKALNQIVNKYLLTFNCEFSVVFTNNKGLSCDIMNRGEEVPYENLSNGQSQQVNLAILFTFIEFLKIKNSSNFPAIFLDEMFDGSMSPEALREVIKGVSQNIPYVNIITHREQNVEMADVLIQVSREGKFSRYEKIFDTTEIAEVPEVVTEINNVELF